MNVFNNKSLKFEVGLILFLTVITSVFAADIPRPEHPRPDMLRTNWVTLNGEWQFEIDEAENGEQRGLISGKDLQGKIVVPFCPESKLSGIGLGNTRYFKHCWYRRNFELPSSMAGKRIRLHFGGVDYKTKVYVNGNFAGEHIGGSASFWFDITPFIQAGSNEIVVYVFDDLRSARQPGGKQSYDKSEGCVYTRVTGIWQPVWLEAVGSTFIENISIVPDTENSRVLIDAAINGSDSGLELVGEAFADGKSVGKDNCMAIWRNNRLVVNLKRTKLWNLDSPFLYDIKFTLKKGNRVIDEVSSYFGLRKISIDGRSILINGKRVFQRLILDQGYYPDGVWTAPSEEALRRDIELSMAAGFNGARLHQKVFEPRYLYWADKLGYIVWGEFPNWGFDYRPENYANYINEWIEVVLRDRNHPSIVGWCPFNETPRQAAELQRIIWNINRAIDPTRPALETSGWFQSIPNPEVRDDHNYNQDPKSFKQKWVDYFSGGKKLRLPERYSSINSAEQDDLGVPFMVSEFGGTFWGKTENGWGYGGAPVNIEDFYKRYEGLVNALLDNPNIFSFCYTQLTDVEQEHNGLYFYDRSPKFDAKRLYKITARQSEYEKVGPKAGKPSVRYDARWEVIVGAAPDGNQEYRFTTNTPPQNWFSENFDAGSWQTGLAPFGTISNPKTRWTTSDIWLRKKFEVKNQNIKTAALVVFYDEDTEVFVNGKKIWERSGFTTRYEIFDVTDELKKVIKPDVNTIAVHTHQTGGGQFIDLALLSEPEN